MPIEFVQVDERIALVAGRVKATYSMSYADGFVVATAIVKEAKKGSFLSTGSFFRKKV